MREDQPPVGLELVTIGRVSVDLYAREQGVGFAEVETFAKSVGGSPTNVAVAAARLGAARRRRSRPSATIRSASTCAAPSPGRFGVDVRFVGTHPTLRTPLAFAAMDPPEEPQLLFYREPDAPDMQIELRGDRPRGRARGDVSSGSAPRRSRPSPRAARRSR